MLKNYFKIAFRNLLKNPAYSFINIGGLTIGIVCGLFIFQYLAFEYSFDDFNEDKDTLYRVNQVTVPGKSPLPMSGYALGSALMQEVPEVERFTRLHPEYENAIVSNPLQPEKTFEEENVFYADSSFFRMFSYPLVSGDRENALSEPGTVLLSQTAAEKYFGGENPIGKTLDVTGWVEGTYRVDGIFRDVLANSHLQFDFVLPMADLLQRSYRDPNAAWNWMNFITYVQLRPDADPKEVEQKFTGVLQANMREVFADDNIDTVVDIQPLENIHLNDDIIAPKSVMGSYRTACFFLIIGVVTLLIALINYINLTTARALKRAREVGIRKAIGAQKRQLAIQFLFESALIILIASALSFFIAELLQPIVNKVAGTHLTNAIWAQMNFWVVFSGLFGLVTLLGGLYPAFVLSSFKPIQVLKGKTGTSYTDGLWLRRGLVVFQFTTAIVLLAGTAIVYNQLDYMRAMDLGINIEQIITVPTPRVLPRDTDRATAVETFKQEITRIPAVRQTATSSSVPGRGYGFKTLVGHETDPTAKISAAGTHVDKNFADLYGLELIAGDGFRDITLPTPDDDPRPVIATETALQSIGIDTPEEALGKEALTGRIVGVFKDFNWSSAHEEPANSFFVLSEGLQYISIKVDTQLLPQTISTIEEAYKELFPGNPFQYSFVDEVFYRQYQNDQRFASLFNIFAGLAITIACLGLFGLAAFTAEQRTKEIGVRKVLGASVMNIISLMSKDFIVLVLVGFVTAVPIAWYVMSQWLQNFAYRIDVGFGVFLIAGLAAVVIALVTISWQSIKAALTNPAKSLRTE